MTLYVGLANCEQWMAHSGDDRSIYMAILSQALPLTSLTALHWGKWLPTSNVSLAFKGSITRFQLP
jgi:hypothetical protein